MDISCNFHYIDEDGNNTVPDKATRITLLVYDEFHKISKRVDWKRDDANIYEDCSLLLEKNELALSTTNAFENMKNFIDKLKNGMKRYSEDTLNDMK